MKNYKISVVIVHWNTPELLRQQLVCLDGRKDIEIIVVDNASKPTKELLKCFTTLKQNNVVIIKNRENKGFAKANNQGARIARGEWLLFLNPDVLLTTDNILELVTNAEKLHMDACSPEPSSKNYKKPLPTWYSLLIEFTPLRRFFPIDIVSKTYTLTGGCLLIQSDTFNKLGGWDERFFLWFEDSDLTKQLIDQGYKTGWVNIPHKHIGGASIRKLSEDKQKKLFFTSMKKYADKHFNWLEKQLVNMVIFWNLHITRSSLHAS